MTVMLLVETAQGDTVAVRFPDSDTARDWEDNNPDVVAQGCIRVVTKAEALRLSKRG